MIDTSPVTTEPLDPLALKMLAAWNCVTVDQLPVEYRSAPTPTVEAWTRVANAARKHFGLYLRHLESCGKNHHDFDERCTCGLAAL